MKVAAVELRGEICDLGMEMQGPFGAAYGPDAAWDGRWQHGFIVQLAGKIGGGTSEIQRNTIAQHVLGLPRG
jgi:alkylation response protein AidB-like acyl-CoA dehydrogenase